MAEHQEIIEYLEAAFPTGQVLPPRSYATAVAPVFPVIEGYVERQIEIAQPILDDWKGHTVVHMLRTNRSGMHDRPRPARADSPVAPQQHRDGAPCGVPRREGPYPALRPSSRLRGLRRQRARHDHRRKPRATQHDDELRTTAVARRG